MGTSTRSERGLGAPSARLKLRFARGDTWLMPGRYVIGRSPSCHIAIDDSLVSREHALIEVTLAGKVTIRDTRSVNGVYLNGTRLGALPAELHAGSRIVIGNEAIDILQGTELPPARQRMATLSDPSGAPPSATDDEEEPTLRALFSEIEDEQRPLNNGMHAAPTQRVEMLSLFHQVVNDALSEGRAADAEELVGVHLRNVLTLAQSGGETPDGTLVQALDLALDLALAGRAGWFDFVVELLDALRILPPTDALLAKMARAVAVSPRIDSYQLSRWVSSVRLRLSGFSIQDLARLDRLESILATVMRGKR